MKIPRAGLVSAVALALVVMMDMQARGAEISWGGYGNMHWMDMEGMPRFLDNVAGNPTPDLTNPLKIHL